MTVKELMDILKDKNPDAFVVISKVLHSPFSTVSIGSIEDGFEGKIVYLKAKSYD